MWLFIASTRSIPPSKTIQNWCPGAVVTVVIVVCCVGPAGESRTSASFANEWRFQAFPVLHQELNVDWQFLYACVFMTLVTWPCGCNTSHKVWAHVQKYLHSSCQIHLKKGHIYIHLQAFNASIFTRSNPTILIYHRSIIFWPIPLTFTAFVVFVSQWVFREQTEPSKNMCLFKRACPVALSPAAWSWNLERPKPFARDTLFRGDGDGGTSSVESSVF